MTSKKRLLPILVAVLMVFAMTPMTAGTVHAAEAGFVDCEGFKYCIEPDQGTAVICGRAAGNADTEVSIPNEVTYDGEDYDVTKIDYGAFQDDTAITKLTVADGIEEIGGLAFGNCSNLAEISLPDSVTNIAKNSFQGTAYFNDSNNWESGVLYIGKSLIEGDVSGECIIKEDTKTIAKKAFEENGGLTAVTIPASVEKIGNDAFYRCGSLSSVTFAENSSRTHIGTGVFYSCSSLTSIDIPASVNIIEQSSFLGTGLTSIVLPEGLELIDGRMFDSCSSLSEIWIPSTVKEIYDFAFFSCDALTTIHFGGSPSQWAAITGNGKPTIEPADYGKEDVETTLKLSVYDADNNTWLNADDPVYVTSAAINGTDTRNTRVPAGVKATITITPANGYMVRSVSVNGSSSPWSVVQDFRSWTDQETGINTITFTPAEGESYTFSVSLHDAVRVIYDLNGGTVGDDWLGNSRLMSKGSVVSSIVDQFEKITPPAGKVLSAVEIITASWTNTIAAADLNSTAHSYDADVTFKCIWGSDQPELQPATQTITASNVTKTYGNAAFSLGAKTNGDGTLTYKSSNTKVATVDNAGKVTIKGAGTAKITISASATANYKAASKTITVTVNKASNPLKIGPKTATVKYSKLKKKTQTLAVTKVIKFTKKLNDKKTYTLVSAKKGSKSFKKYFKISKTTGKVTIKKKSKMKKGTYKVKVKVKALGNTNYKASGTKTVTFKVKVK